MKERFHWSRKLSLENQIQLYYNSYIKDAPVKQTVRLGLYCYFKKATQLWSVRLLFWCLNLSTKSITFTIVLIVVTIIPAILRIVSNISKKYPLLYFPQNHLRWSWKFSYVIIRQRDKPLTRFGRIIIIVYMENISKSDLWSNRSFLMPLNRG